ncbi:MAG: DUF1588 domain-containing protein [Myxococcales bacterium]
MLVASCLAGCVGALGEPSGPLNGSARPGDIGDSADAPLSACTNQPSAAAAPLRRLTRKEYTRAVRDVFGVTTSAADAFAADERVGGTFASNADANVATIQLRQYMEAAEAISTQVDVGALMACPAASADELACVTHFLDSVGRRAYRRPLADDERERLLSLFTSLRTNDDFESSMRVLVQTLLQSPHFLYHLELDNSAAPRPINGLASLPAFARASRMAFLLWASVPDDALLDAAGRGELDATDGVRAQAQRMLDDPRARDALGEFHAEWLGLERLEGATRDPAIYPEWNADLANALRADVERYADELVRGRQASFRELISTSLSFAQGASLALFGAGEATPQADGALSLDPARRAGLLTQPGFLAAHSHMNQSAPVQRGRAIRERLFCQPLPDPPPNVAANPPPLDAMLTTRERFALHQTSGSACANCHQLIDGIGFSLEHYDALGRFRANENGKPIDAHFSLTSTDVDGDYDGALALSEQVAQSAQARSCYATQWFRFGFGRVEQKADACSVQRASEALQDDGAIRDMLLSMVVSDSFLYQVVEEP